MVTAWGGNSIFLGGLKVQWHTLSRWFANVEIKVRLLVAFKVLLSPQDQQKRRKLRKDNLRPRARIFSFPQGQHIALWTPFFKALFLRFQLGVVFADERLNIRRTRQDAEPLFFVERDRKTAHAVQRDPAPSRSPSK